VSRAIRHLSKQQSARSTVLFNSDPAPKARIAGGIEEMHGSPMIWINGEIAGGETAGPQWPSRLTFA
jgi:hypothetical protein